MAPNGEPLCLQLLIRECSMKTFKIAALAAGLLLQSLAYPANAPAHDSVSAKIGTSGRAEASRDYFLIPDINALHDQDCDPEDDCPRPD